MRRTPLFELVGRHATNSDATRTSFIHVNARGPGPPMASDTRQLGRRPPKRIVIRQSDSWIRLEIGIQTDLFAVHHFTVHHGCALAVAAGPGRPDGRQPSWWRPSPSPVSFRLGSRS